MEDISIPMVKGNMEDIGQESTANESTADSSMGSSQQIHDRESRYCIYFLLTEQY